MTDVAKVTNSYIPYKSVTYYYGVNIMTVREGAVKRVVKRIYIYMLLNVLYRCAAAASAVYIEELLHMYNINSSIPSFTLNGSYNRLK